MYPLRRLLADSRSNEMLEEKGVSLSRIQPNAKESELIQLEQGAKTCCAATEQLRITPAGCLTSGVKAGILETEYQFGL